MKTIIVNASPRKNWNTAQLLKSAAKGAEFAGSEVEYINLYDLTFVGCHSCLACKRNDAKPRYCYWKDDLSPIIDRIYAADTLIMGSPIYLMDTTSQFHALMERLVFVNLSYDTPYLFSRNINIGAIFTMNASIDWYTKSIEPRVNEQLGWLRGMNGKVIIIPSMDTLQVNDYSRYSMSKFDPVHKQHIHETQFPMDLGAAYRMGMELCRV